jgi:hypothetical protein
VFVALPEPRIGLPVYLFVSGADFLSQAPAATGNSGLGSPETSTFTSRRARVAATKRAGVREARYLGLLRGDYLVDKPANNP